MTPRALQARYPDHGRRFGSSDRDNNGKSVFVNGFGIFGAKFCSAFLLRGFSSGNQHVSFEGHSANFSLDYFICQPRHVRTDALFLLI